MSATLADHRKLASSLLAFAAFYTQGILDSSAFSLSSTDLTGSVSENAVSRYVGFSALPDSDYIPMDPLVRPISSVSHFFSLIHLAYHRSSRINSVVEGSWIFCRQSNA